MNNVAKAAVLGNFGDFVFAGSQKVLGVVDSDFGDVLVHVHSGFAFEQGAKIVGGNVYVGGKFFYLKPFAVMRGNITNNFINTIIAADRFHFI
jgi:hypothetical protein